MKTIHLPWVLLLAGSILGCQRGDSAGPPAARVDGNAISLASLKLAPSGTSDAQRKAALEKAIAEQLMANAAIAAKLDADTGVQAAIESARRQVLAQAYFDRQKAAKPPLTEADIQRYYDEHPELFAQRKVYRLQEIAVRVAPEKVPEIQNALKGMRTFGDRARWLKQHQVEFTTNVVVRGAEDWPADLLQRLATMKDGTAFELGNGQGYSMLQLTGIELQPRPFDQSRTSIARFLTNQRAGELLNAETRRLRAAAKVEYLPPFDKL